MLDTKITVWGTKITILCIKIENSMEITICYWKTSKHFYHKTWKSISLQTNWKRDLQHHVYWITIYSSQDLEATVISTSRKMYKQMWYVQWRDSYSAIKKKNKWNNLLAASCKDEGIVLLREVSLKETETPNLVCLCLESKYWCKATQFQDIHTSTDLENLTSVTEGRRAV